MMTGPEVLKMVLMPASTFRPSALNSGPRWSMTGMSMARRMRSGTGVGPGICRKWRPARRGALDMDVLSTWAQWRLGRNSDSVLRHAVERQDQRRYGYGRTGVIKTPASFSALGA